MKPLFSRDRLSNIRNRQGFTQKALAAKIKELSDAESDTIDVVISRHERGIMSPSADYLGWYAKALGVSSDYLLTLTDSTRPHDLSYDETLVLDAYRNGKLDELLKLIRNTKG
jgi:transcriptional regulator with XRE-family HTH domain